jgi:hypothetical protein
MPSVQDPPAENILVTPIKDLLGSQATRDIVTRDGLLSRFKLGLVEAGGLPTPLQHEMADAAAGAAPQVLTIKWEVPAGTTIRLIAASAWATNAANDRIVCNWTTIGVAGIPASPGLTMTGGTARSVDLAAHKFPMVANDTGGNAATIEGGKYILHPGHFVIGEGEVQNIGEKLKVAIAYVAWPAGTRPPY